MMNIKNRIGIQLNNFKKTKFYLNIAQTHTEIDVLVLVWLIHGTSKNKKNDNRDNNQKKKTDIKRER